VYKRYTRAVDDERQRAICVLTILGDWENGGHRR
jgi:hypothetical protein